MTASKPVTGLSTVELQELVTRAVCRGALQAVGILFLISAVLTLLFYVVRSS